MMASKLFVTPIEQNLILSHLEIRKWIKKMYQWVVVKLMYLGHTELDVETK